MGTGFARRAGREGRGARAGDRPGLTAPSSAAALQERRPGPPAPSAPSPGGSGPRGPAAVLEGRLLLEVSPRHPRVSRRVTAASGPLQGAQGRLRDVSGGGDRPRLPASRGDWGAGAGVEAPRPRPVGPETASVLGLLVTRRPEATAGSPSPRWTSVRPLAWPSASRAGRRGPGGLTPRRTPPLILGCSLALSRGQFLTGMRVGVSHYHPERGCRCLTGPQLAPSRGTGRVQTSLHERVQGHREAHVGGPVTSS